MRELKQPRRRSRGRHLKKNEVIFYKRISRLSRLVPFANGSKRVLKLNTQRRLLTPNGHTKSYQSSQRSVDDTQLGHFTLLFCGGRQRNVQRFITHLHSYCSLNLLCSDVLVAVVVVVCLSSLWTNHDRRRPIKEVTGSNQVPRSLSTELVVLNFFL